MPRFERRPFTAAVLVLALVLLPAAPVLAAPADAGPASWLARLVDWLPWPNLDAPSKASSASEIDLPNSPPVQVRVGDEPNATTTASPPDSGGEIWPTMDPDG